MHASVKINGDAEILAHLLAHGGHPRDRLVDMRECVHIVDFIDRAHLHRPQAFVFSLLRLPRDI